MPNNSSARRVKDKKSKDKKKEGQKDDQRTDTLSLPKEDKAGMDSGTPSLSPLGLEKANMDRESSLSILGTKVAAKPIVPVISDADLIMGYLGSLTDMEKFDLQDEVVKANPGVNPGVSAREFAVVKKAFILKKALKLKDSRTHSLSLSSAGKDKATKVS